VPAWETILDGINQGDLSLHYARWQYPRGTATGAVPGPMLELAYWIGPTPGVESNDVRLDRYRDATPRGGVRDTYVVFHLHLEEGTEMLRNVQGRTYMGIPRLSFFHGQDITVDSNGGWRVDNEDPAGFNSRAGFNCPEDGIGQALWYIGTPLDLHGLSDGELRFWNRLDTWARNLFNAGYTGTAGQGLIFQSGAMLPNGDIDPGNPGILLRPGGASSQAGGQDPYRLSFTTQNMGQNHWSYSFAPRRPPSPH
jgi:chitinase